ncbi:MAG: T9SS type A sorting domain-containing protein, partial [Pedobacter sp.]
LTVGEQVITLEVVSGDFDFDRMDFSVVLPAVTPTNLIAAAYGSAKINLSWSASANATSYKLERSESTNGTFTVVADNLTATTFDDETVLPATTYYYRVKGVNILGDGVASTNVIATTAAFTIPAKVTGVTVAAGNAWVNIGWATQVDVAEYLVKRATMPGGPYVTVATVSNTPYQDETVANNTTYYYVVSAKNSLGEGDVSDEIIAMPSNEDYAYWSFDHGNTATAVTDSWGAFNGSFDNDVSIGTNTSTSDLTFLEAVNSHLNNSLRFRGKAKSYVKLPAGIMSDVNDFTISLWYRQISNVSGARIFDFGVGDEYTTSTPIADRNMMYLIARGTDNKVVYGIQKGSTIETVETAATLQIGAQYWTHIVITQAGNTVTVYVNGAQVGQKTGMTIKPSDLGATTHNYFGRSRFAGSARIDGVMDEFKIYSKALTASEIIQLNGGVLPVDFLDFTAQKQSASGVMLNWSTAKEQNNSHFEILRSIDGKSFKKIINVKGSINSNELRKYQYTDRLPHSGANYYQLKQVDLDGKDVFHPKVVAVSLSLDNKGDVKIYAASNKLNLEVKAMENADFDLQLSDLTGRRVKSIKDRVKTGTNSFQYSLENLTSGIYIATYFSKGEKMSVKLVLN